MLYVSKVKRKKKSTLLKENNNKMLYVSEVIKTKGLEKKKIHLHIGWNHHTRWNLVEWTEMDGIE